MFGSNYTGYLKFCYNSIQYVIITYYNCVNVLTIFNLYIILFLVNFNYIMKNKRCKVIFFLKGQKEPTYTLRVG